MPSVETFDNQGFVGVLAFVLVGETNSYDSMSIISSEAQALTGGITCQDNQGLNESKARLIILQNNDSITTGSTDYIEVKRLTYEGAGVFTKVYAEFFSSFNGTGYAKIVYTINDGEENLIKEVEIPINGAVIDEDINVQTAETDKISFILYMKANYEQVGNDVFKVYLGTENFI